MRKNSANKGFSLIELLVVIAIMGIFTGASFVAFGLVQSGNVKNVTKSLGTGLQETRQKTMTQNLAYGWTFVVEKDASGKVSMTTVQGVAADAAPIEVRTELKKCSMFYTNNEGAEYEISRMRVTFDASTGAVKNIEYMPVDGSVMTQTAGVGKIRVTSSTKESELSIFFATGKYEIK